MPPVLKILWDSGPGVVSWRDHSPPHCCHAAHLLSPKSLNTSFRILPIKSAAASRCPHNFWYPRRHRSWPKCRTRPYDSWRSTTPIRFSPTATPSTSASALWSRLPALTSPPTRIPVFYDRLERARVQATDRLAMIQQMGRLFTAGHHYAGLFRRPWPLRISLACTSCSQSRRSSFLPRRNPLRLPRLREELPPDPSQAPDGLPAAGRRQPRRRQGSKALSV